MKDQRLIYALMAVALLIILSKTIADGSWDELLAPILVSVFVGCGFIVNHLLGVPHLPSPITGVVVVGTMLTTMLVGLFVFSSFDVALVVAGACGGAAIIVLGLKERSRLHIQP